jgi:hypothetical protein
LPDDVEQDGRGMVGQGMEYDVLENVRVLEIKRRHCKDGGVMEIWDLDLSNLLTRYHSTYSLGILHQFTCLVLTNNRNDVIR